MTPALGFGYISLGRSLGLREPRKPEPSAARIESSFTYKGKPCSELSREELIQIIEAMYGHQSAVDREHNRQLALLMTGITKVGV